MKPAPVHTATAAEASIRRRLAALTRAGAHPGGTRAKDRELTVHLRLLRVLDPEFAARARTAAGLPPR
jgi:hypothetical protein